MFGLDQLTSRRNWRDFGRLFRNRRYDLNEVGELIIGGAQLEVISSLKAKVVFGFLERIPELLRVGITSYCAWLELPFRLRHGISPHIPLIGHQLSHRPPPRFIVRRWKKRLATLKPPDKPTPHRHRQQAPLITMPVQQCSRPQERLFGTGLAYLIRLQRMMLQPILRRL